MSDLHVGKLASGLGINPAYWHRCGHLDGERNTYAHAANPYQIDFNMYTHMHTVLLWYRVYLLKSRSGFVRKGAAGRY